MRKTNWTLAWLALAVLAPVPRGIAAQDPLDEEKAPGRRLAVTFVETREGGSGTVETSRSCTLALHADGGPSHLFMGTQAAIHVGGQGEPTTIFKNIGVTAGLSATTLPDGRYRLDASYEESAELPMGPDPTVSGSSSNPIIQVVRGESRLTLRPGETASLARAVDPVTGEVVRVDVTATESAVSRASSSGSGGDARLQARLVLVRRRGQTKTVRRPYAVVLLPRAAEPGDGADDSAASVFSGSMLPVQVMVNNQVTVALKDVGAGIRIHARRVDDGRVRLDVEFSDGVLAPGRDGPQIRTFESDSTVFVRVGETVPVASASDPLTGEVVEAEVTLEEVR